ncbi:MAG TPA: polyhydroxyalkanoate synthesis regulator DNA-binding domain-containing protein [bacterium]|nr:polyhydroxyalkanoate synthesis regulator DNA-binding domain-containing protein [bacterium]
MLIKKYGNRRLYDTDESRYITLEELAEKIRRGEDARVVDAKSGADLTQGTLAQIILESRGAGRLLPVPLLTQMVRMGDDALAEFFSRYVGAALELYFQAKQGAQAIAPMNPFMSLPFTAGNALARLFGAGTPSWESQPQQPAPSSATASSADMADLRRQLDELKKSLRKPKKRKR